MPDPTPQNTSLYEEVLSAASRAAGAPRPPRPSAAIVLWRRPPSETAGHETASGEPGGAGPGGCEVFWIRRARAMAFMGGWYAFPGGGLGRGDAAVEVHGLPRGIEPNQSSVPEMPESLTDGLGELPVDLAPGVLACALRELLEETGILPLPELFERSSEADGPESAEGADAGASASAGSDATALGARLTEARRRLLAEPKRFAEIASELSLRLDASRLAWAGRWLTPPLGPYRFDNRFFLLHWPSTLPVQPLVVPGEAELGEWIRPAEAIARWRRGSVITAPPILHILQVLAEEEISTEDELAGGGPALSGPSLPSRGSRLATRLHRPDEANLGPYRRIEFRPGVISLPMPTATLPPATHTNAYLLGRGERVLVDPGSGDEREIERLVAAVQASATQGHPVREIWLTHHHPDHVGGLVPVARRLGLPVRAHAATFERLAGLAGFLELTLGQPFADGDRVELAGEPATVIEVLHTPGHARGHLCFLDLEGRSLLAGDMVSAVSTIVVDPPEGDMDEYLASLERLAALGPTTLFPGHGPPVLHGQAKLREFIQHRLWREERILEAWHQGHRRPVAIRPLVYEEVPEPAWPLAERQIQAHLDRLERAAKL